MTATTTATRPRRKTTPIADVPESAPESAGGAPPVSPGIGHNASPEPVPPTPLTPEQILAWLRQDNAPLMARQTEMVGALTKTIDAYTTVDTDEQAGIVAENVRMAKDVIKLTDAAHTAAKAPFLTGGRAVDGWKNGLVGGLTPLIAALQTKLTAFAVRKDAQRREAARQQEEAARLEAERQAQAAIAATDASEREVSLAQMENATKEADKAARTATAAPSTLGQVRGEFGAVSSLRRTWKWRVTDMAKVPLQYLQPDPDAIKAAAAERDPDTRKPTAVIPGIEWYADDQANVR